MKTLEQLMQEASQDKYGKASDGRFTIYLVPVGKPRQGLSSGAFNRLDCYVDGKRVAKAVFLTALVEAL
jgi:hypothetical protein